MQGGQNQPGQRPEQNGQNGKGEAPNQGQCPTDNQNGQKKKRQDFAEHNETPSRQQGRYFAGTGAPPDRISFQRTIYYIPGQAG